MVKRSRYGGGTASKQDIIENAGNDCYMPTSGNFFINCINQLIGEDYTEGF